MSISPLQNLKKVVVKHTANECIAIVKQLKYKIDINTLHRIENIDGLEMNDIGRISIRTSKTLFYDTYKKNRQTEVLSLLMSKLMKLLGLV